ncbi:hypothetical protein PLICRDRAFT_243275 [Plicaturopsis crispa FD-325 SS-3]|nr:hypothetical protein PLICRDRAFT_243275 [Plicaturopsis crispa FD-325 SS-3]
MSLNTDTGLAQRPAAHTFDLWPFLADVARQRERPGPCNRRRRLLSQLSTSLLVHVHVLPAASRRRDQHKLRAISARLPDLFQGHFQEYGSGWCCACASASVSAFPRFSIIHARFPRARARPRYDPSTPTRSALSRTTRSPLRLSHGIRTRHPRVCVQSRGRLRP